MAWSACSNAFASSVADASSSGFSFTGVFWPSRFVGAIEAACAGGADRDSDFMLLFLD
jgi:hypothetical protein